MIKLHFKRRDIAEGTLSIAERLANCVPRSGESVSLEIGVSFYVVDRVEYMFMPAPEKYYSEEVWVWLK